MAVGDLSVVVGELRVEITGGSIARIGSLVAYKNAAWAPPFKIIKIEQFSYNNTLQVAIQGIPNNLVANNVNPNQLTLISF